MAISRDLMKNVRSAVETALVEVGQKLGVSFQLEGGRYTPMEGHWKLNVLPVENELESFQKIAWNRWAKLNGFNEEDLGAKFRSGEYAFIIEGLNPRRHKYPITAKRVSDGKTFKFTINQVLTGLGRPVRHQLFI